MCPRSPGSSSTPSLQPLAKCWDCTIAGRQWHLSRLLQYPHTSSAPCSTPRTHPDPTPEQAIRFTRKNHLYRAGVLATYGRIYGTPFNVIFYISDVLLSLAADSIIGERPVGTKQRRSEFLTVLLWVFGSNIVQMLVIPIDTSGLGLVVGMVDRTLWRAVYVVLVDDVVGVLTRPHIRTLTGKATLVLVQTIMILWMVYVVSAGLKKHYENGVQEEMMELGVWRARHLCASRSTCRLASSVIR
jgi:hypothetical protein